MLCKCTSCICDHQITTCGQISWRWQDCNLSSCPSCPRWSGCVITAGSSRRSWPSRAIGSLVQLGNPLASAQPSVSRPCAKLPVTKSSGLAPKHPRARPPQSKTPTDPVPPGTHLAPTLGHVASHHETRKLTQCRNQQHLTCNDIPPFNTANITKNVSFFFLLNPCTGRHIKMSNRWKAKPT